MEATIKRYLMAFISIAVIARLIPIISDAVEVEGLDEAEQGLLNLVVLLAVVGVLMLAVRSFFK